MEEEGMGVGAGLFLCFHLIHKGRGEGGHGSGLIPSFLFISFCLVVSLQSWLLSPQLARPLSTQPLPPLRSGGLPGSQVGPACVVEFVEPGLPALCPRPASPPRCGDCLGVGSSVPAATPAAELALVLWSNHWDPRLCVSFSPPCTQHPTPPHPRLVRLRLHPLCPWGNPTRTL